MTAETVEQKHYPHQLRNLLAFGTDAVFFGLAIGFLNPHTVLPAFASALGGSAVLVGLVSTAFMLSWDLPQLVAGSVVARYVHKKPILLWTAYVGRMVVPLLAALVFATNAQPAWLSIAALFLTLIVWLGTDAFAALAWLDMLGRAFPPDKRGGYLGWWQVIKSVGVLGVAAIVRYLLGDAGPGFPSDYAMIFGLGAVSLFISAAAMAFIYEVPEQDDGEVHESLDWREFPIHLRDIWVRDRRLRQVTLSRVLFRLSTMAFPFYILFATEQKGFPIEAVGTFLSAETIGILLSSIVLGQVADRLGAQRAIQIGVAVVATAGFVALMLVAMGADLSGLIQLGFFWIYMTIGVSENLSFIGYLNYMLDVAPPRERTLYIGAMNAIGSIGLIGPVLGGWLLNFTSYSALFAVSIVMGIGALIFALMLPARKKKSQGVAAAD